MLLFKKKEVDFKKKLVHVTYLDMEGKEHVFTYKADPADRNQDFSVRT